MDARRAIAAVAVAGALAVVACSVLVPLDDTQCSADADCAARGAAFAGAVCVDHVCKASPLPPVADGGADATADANDAGGDGARDPWRCLADPPPVIDPGAPIDLEIKALDALKTIVSAGPNGGSDLDILSGTPLTGVTVTRCNAFDPNCASPILPSQTTDDAGVTHFAVHGDFDGYFELSRNGIFPSTVYPGHLLADSGAQSIPFPLLSVFATDQLASTLGVSLATDPDGGLGHAFFLIYDCDDRHAPGVSFSLGDASVDGSAFFYTQGAFPNPKATQTDALGTGGTINYPAGFVVVTATEAATGRPLGSASTFIRAGGTTLAWIRVRTR